jgi:hypothetical protein
VGKGDLNESSRKGVNNVSNLLKWREQSGAVYCISFSDLWTANT